MTDQESLLQDCLAFLSQLKTNHGLYSGRYGMNHTERTELNDLLKLARQRSCQQTQ